MKLSYYPMCLVIWWNLTQTHISTVSFLSDISIFSAVGGGGRSDLPEFKFLVKFPIGLQVILQLQIKNSKLSNILSAKLF